MDPLGKMRPQPFRRRFFTPFAARNSLRMKNTAVAASRRHSLNEFKKASEIYPNDAGADRKASAHLIIWMSFQLTIPWWVALQQSPPPLRQPKRTVQHFCGADRWISFERHIR